MRVRHPEAGGLGRSVLQSSYELDRHAGAFLCTFW